MVQLFPFSNTILLPVMEVIDMWVLRKKLRASCLRRKYKRLHHHLLLQILHMKEFLPLFRINVSNVK